MEDTTEQSNDAWFGANLLDLVEKYPHRWIAVLDRTVIATAATKGGVEAEARRLAAGREFSLYYVEPSILQM
jgi:hypothetical protein